MESQDYQDFTEDLPEEAAGIFSDQAEQVVSESVETELDDDEIEDDEQN